MSKNDSSKADNTTDASEKKYTGWFGLFKESNGKWTCVDTVDSNNLPKSWETDGEPEWDLALPIPEPSTVREFEGW